MVTRIESRVARRGRWRDNLDVLAWRLDSKGEPLKYHCPYCRVSIDHRPELAGERVVCSACKGAYYEPTDPLPGILPEKAPTAEEAEVVGGDQPKFEPVDGPTVKSLAQCEPVDMVGEITNRGKHSLMITWPAGKTQEANMAYSDSLTREQVNDMILEIAVHLIRDKWPDVYQLVAGRVGK